MLRENSGHDSQWKKVIYFKSGSPTFKPSCTRPAVHSVTPGPSSPPEIQKVQNSLLSVPQSWGSQGPPCQAPFSFILPQFLPPCPVLPLFLPDLWSFLVSLSLPWSSLHVCPDICLHHTKSALYYFPSLLFRGFHCGLVFIPHS